MAMIAAEADIVAIPQTFSKTPSNTANAVQQSTESVDKQQTAASQSSSYQTAASL